MTPLDNAHFISSNMAAWDESAPYHKTTPAWQALLDDVAHAGFSCLDLTLTQLLTDAGLDGKDAIQIGCNNGRECFSMKTLGARSVVGIDQSAQFLHQAQELLAHSPHDVEFIEADVYHLPATLNQRFDVALITIGVLNWMPDLHRFFACVGATLRPGGQIIIYETHPFLDLFEPAASNPFQLAYSYFRTEPFRLENPLVYEAEIDEQCVASYWFTHSLSAIISSLINNKLQVSHFREYPHSNREQLYDCYRAQSAQLPMCFSLCAVKNARAIPNN